MTLDQQFSGAHHDFSWDTLRLFLEGFSPVDLPNLAITSRDEAEHFIQAYGYDLNNPRDREEADAVHAEAIAFITRYLCPGSKPEDPDLVIPTEISSPSHLTDLLLLSSDSERPLLAAWACSALRVMHTISHANLAVRTPHYEEIQSQILDPFREHIYPDLESPKSLGQGPFAVPLKACFFKSRKSRESLILKLLHKPDNVASEVYDRIGIKLITPTKLDALLALKYLRKQNLVSIPLITPGRSRNTLVDLDKFREAYESLTVNRDSRNEDDTDEEFVKQLAFRPAKEALLLDQRLAANPHSSPEFRSIQFTCRQLVKVCHPAIKAIQELREKTGDQSLGRDLEAEYPDQLRFTFPFEVQISDWDSYMASRQGEGSHASYKRRQLQAARKRVLGQVLLETAKIVRTANSRRGKLLNLVDAVDIRNPNTLSRAEGKSPLDPVL